MLLQMVAIVDPHIKRTEDFRIYKDAQEKNVITKKADGTTNFEGWCWTGSSVWVDFLNPASWSWWTDMFSFNVWKVWPSVDSSKRATADPCTMDRTLQNTSISGTT